MGIDYDSTAGYGIRISKEYLEKLGWKEEHEIDEREFLDDLFDDSEYLSLEEYGNCYSGETERCLLVKDCSNFRDLAKNVSLFIEELRTYNLVLSDEDIEFINEEYIS